MGKEKGTPLNSTAVSADGQELSEAVLHHD
jgi:hypothetical protein